VAILDEDVNVRGVSVKPARSSPNSQVTVPAAGGSSRVEEVRLGRGSVRGRSALPVSIGGEQTVGHLLGEHGEGAVVAPLAVDVHVPLPQTFVAEAELVDHTQTGGVLRADVDLDAVESEREEAVVDGHRHGDGSDAASGDTRVDPVPDLPGQDRPPAQ